MPHSDNSYACLRDNNSVFIFFKRKKQQQHTHTHTRLASKTTLCRSRGNKTYITVKSTFLSVFRKVVFLYLK